jgi:hypothetical protein
MTTPEQPASPTAAWPAPAVPFAPARRARLAAASPRRLTVAPPPTADAWTRYLSGLLATEIGAAVTNETITPAEAEQLLARLVLVIDQAITTKQP